MASSLTRFLDHTQRRITVGSTPLDEWSASSSQRPLPDNTKHSQDKHPCPRWDSNPRSQQASGLQTYALDRAATGTGRYLLFHQIFFSMVRFWLSHCDFKGSETSKNCNCLYFYRYCVYYTSYQMRGPDSSVGIATDYGLDGPGLNPSGDEIFPPVQTGPGAHPASCTMGTGCFPGVEAAGAWG